MGASVEVDTSELRARVAEFAKRGQNLEPIMQVIAEDLVAAVSDEFETDGHGKWPPHAASTVKRRRGGGSGAKLLQDTGVLASSVEPRWGPDFAEAGTGVPYVVYHLEGGPVIPRRNPFDVPDDVYDDAEETLLDFLTSPP